MTGSAAAFRGTCKDLHSAKQAYLHHLDKIIPQESKPFTDRPLLPNYHGFTKLGAILCDSQYCWPWRAWLARARRLQTVLQKANCHPR